MKNILIRNALGNELGVIDITSSSYVTSKILRMTTEPQYISLKQHYILASHFGGIYLNITGNVLRFCRHSKYLGCDIGT